MTRFVACPRHVRSADLDRLAVVIDLRTGAVESLLGWTHHAWLVLAATGDLAKTIAALPDVPADAVEAFVCQLVTDELLIESPKPAPWRVPTVAPGMPSWGTQEVVAGIPPVQRISLTGEAIAVVAVVCVSVVQRIGSRKRSFARVVGLLTAVTQWSAGNASRDQVERALECVRHVARLAPFRVACLEETAAAMLVLALTGRRAGWCHGVAADPVRLHAWLALDGKPVAEPASTTRYTPLVVIPSPPGSDSDGEGDEP